MVLNSTVLLVFMLLWPIFFNSTINRGLFQVTPELAGLSYREIFDQLFEALESSKLITPAGTLKRRKNKPAIIDSPSEAE